MMSVVLRIISCSLLLFFNLYAFAEDFIDDGSSSIDISITTPTPILSRLEFPANFVFGAGSSAYQVEGAAAEGGRKPSIWDTFVHDGKTSDKDTGDIAADQYHKYKDDVKLMHQTGLDAYRFSISWSRVIPDGRGDVNPEGIDYYNNLINELVTYGIQAHVTLSHFDIPQALQDEYDGQLGPKFIEDFTAYADVCFKEYGDRVNSWITFNEPNIQTVAGNGFGMMPPGRCSYPFGVNCTEGDSSTEPYVAAHTTLLAHAAAVHLYRTKYQDNQKGQIGITLLGFWLEPLTTSPQDIAASARMRDFHLGWFLDPLVYGKYPAITRKIVGSRLPDLTENDSKRLQDSFDFIGYNHYCALYVQDIPRISDEYGSDYWRDLSVQVSFANGSIVRDFAGMKTYSESSMSWGLQRLLEYLKLKYKNPAAIIDENGIPTLGDGSSNPATRNDTIRIQYIQAYIASLLPSIRNGSNVRGYFVWSFVDCFEVSGGYSSHYGLYEVDFSDKNLRRYPRQSALWYSTFLAKSGRETETSGSLYT